jgi:hypothetical protein
MKKALPALGDRLTTNWPYKVVAVLVSFVLWSAILWSRKDNVMIKPVFMEVMPPIGFSLVSAEPMAVTLKVAGPRSALKRLAQNGSVVSIELKQVRSGENQLKVSDRLLNLPPGVRLLSADPSTLRFGVHMNASE